MKKALLLKPMLLLFALIVGSGTMWADDNYTLVYTLSSETTNSASASSAYNDSYDLEINNITWNVKGNTSLSPWRIGGKKATINSETGTGDRPLYSKGTISDNVAKIVITHGNSTSDITVNSVTLIVSTAQDGGGTVISSLSGSYTNNTTTTFNRPDNADWTGRYYKIVYNVTNTTATQKYLLFSKAEFYKSGNSSVTELNANSPVNITADATSGQIGYSISNPISGTTLTAAEKSPGYDWIDNVTVVTAENKVTFDVTQNEGAERTGVITLTYGDITKDVNVIQAGKYVVTIETPTGGTLVVKKEGEAISSGALVPNGTVLTIEATADENYRFKNWQYNAGAGWQTRTTTFTYTVNSNVSFRANFDLEYAVNWNVNGTVSTVKYIKDEVIKLPNRPTSDNENYVFVGWTTAELNGTQANAPTFLSYGTQMGTSDLTYYAVFANASGTTSTATLTETEIKSINNNQYKVNWEPFTYNDSSDGISWDVSGYFENSNCPWIQLKKDDTAYIKVTSSSNTTSFDEVKLTITSTNHTSGHATEISYYTAYSNTAYLGTSALDTPSGDIASSNVVNSNVIDMVLPISANELYVQVGAGARIWGIDVLKNNYTYSNYCTTIPATTATITINSAATDGKMFYGTFSYPQAFEVPSDLVVSEINVYEGALIVDSYTTGAIVPANTGVMVAALEAGDYIVNLSSESGTSVLGEENFLCPTGDGITATEMAEDYFKFYALTKSGGKLGYWYVVEDGAAFDYNVANRAYLAVPTSELGNAPALGFGFDDETTSIQNIERTISDNQYYTLDGRRVAEPTKGIYIINGKKVVVK